LERSLQLKFIHNQ